MDPIYLDYNATTPIHPDVVEAIQQAHIECYANPASMHRPGQQARKTLEEQRRLISGCLGAETEGMAADRLIFTSGGTESNNLAIFGLLDPAGGLDSAGGLDPTGNSRRVLVSAVEHPSVLMAAERLRSLGFDVQFIPVDGLGRISLESLEVLLRQPTDLVSVMLANNEVGTIQPLREVAQLCHQYGALCHTDAVQAIGKIPVHFRELGVDAMSFTAHKIHGPRGIGGLLLRHDRQIVPMMFGGFQQLGFRPGTEDVALVMGFSTAVEMATRNQPTHGSQMRKLRDALQNLLVSAIPDAQVNAYPGPGGDDPRAPHTLNISFPGINRQALLMAVDFKNLAISTGSACASGSSEPSHVLIAMGRSESTIEGSIRISVGVPTTMAEIEEAVTRILSAVNDLRGSN